MPGKRDQFSRIHARYIKALGNLSEMNKIDWNETFEHWNNWFWWAIGFPVAAIGVSFHLGKTTLGICLLGIYGTILFVFLLIKLFRLAQRIMRRVTGRVEPRVKLFMLWDDMYEVWRRLEGPIVNPGFVDEAMANSMSKGAVWDSASRSLIDRVIAIDAAVWVVQES